MTHLSTAEALAALAGPEAGAAWATLVERHGPDVWRIITSRSRDAHEAEDAYQDFWIALPRAALGFKPAAGDQERGARAWLMRVAYTSAIDHGRRRRSIQASALAATSERRNHDMDAHDRNSTGSGPLGLDLAVPPSERPGSEELTDRSLLVARVQSAIGILPEAYRRPLLLHLVAGLSYEELAADLRCTVNNARVKVHRGLKRLREALGVDEQRLPDRTIAGLAVPLLAMPTAPPLPPPVVLPVPPPHGFLTAALKAASFAAVGTLVAGAMAAAAMAAKSAPVPASAPPQPTAAPAPIAEQALPLDDFERAEPNLEGHGHLDKLPELSIVPAPAGGGHGKALRFGWPADHAIWVDCSYLGTQQRLPQLTAEASGTVTMDVWSDGGADVHHVAVRFVDAKGEIFEWRRPLPERGQSGWRQITLPLSLLKPAHWGGPVNADGIVHLPLRFVGYAAQLEMDEPRHAGALIIDDVVLTVRR